jgi:hypothetical protein
VERRSHIASHQLGSRGRGDGLRHDHHVPTPDDLRAFVSDRLTEPALHPVADHRTSDLPAHRQSEPARVRSVPRCDHHETWRTDPSARRLRATVVGGFPEPRGARKRSAVGTVPPAAFGNPRQDALRCSWKGSSGRAACGPSSGVDAARRARQPSTSARETRGCASASCGWVGTCASREPPRPGGVRTTPLSPLTPSGQAIESPRGRRSEGASEVGSPRIRDPGCSQATKADSCGSPNGITAT